MRRRRQVGLPLLWTSASGCSPVSSAGVQRAARDPLVRRLAYVAALASAALRPTSLYAGAVNQALAHGSRYNGYLPQLVHMMNTGYTPERLQDLCELLDYLLVERLEDPAQESVIRLLVRSDLAGWDELDLRAQLLQQHHVWQAPLAEIVPLADSRVTASNSSLLRLGERTLTSLETKESDFLPFLLRVSEIARELEPQMTAEAAWVFAIELLADVAARHTLISAVVSTRSDRETVQAPVEAVHVPVEDVALLQSGGPIWLQWKIPPSSPVGTLRS